MLWASGLVLGFFSALFPSAASAGPVAGAIALAILPVGASALAVTLTTLAVSAVLTLALTKVSQSLFSPKLPKSAGGVNDIESVQVTTRLANGERVQAAGTVNLGGQAGIFGEFDADGNFWFIVAHAHAEVKNTTVSYILDGIPVTLSDGTDGYGFGDVLENDFCLTSEYDQYEGTGTKVPQFRIWTVTPSAGNAYGTLPTAFTTAFSGLPSDFRLAGVVFSIVRCRAIPAEHRYKSFRWRGPMGLGEPSVSIVGNFQRMYDPRVGAHDIDDDTTWTFGDGNPAIIWAWWWTSPYGRARPMSEVNWTNVAAQANICDETVLDRDSNSVSRYRCGLAANESTPIHEVERQILLSCDGFTATDDAGLAYPVVGKYVAPTLEFTAERDIFAVQTEIVDDGEALVDGVVVNYISPDHGYTKQPCAAWVNPAYYASGRTPNYLFVDILPCQNHNQAFRLAGAIGARVGAPRRATLTTTIKGLLAKNERAASLSLDAEFDGPHEIATPVVADADGIVYGFSVVPLASNRWDGAGQSEGLPPQSPSSLGVSTTIAVAANVAVESESIYADNSTSTRLKATFDAPSRSDRRFEFRFRISGSGNPWQFFNVNMEQLEAYSRLVVDGQDYDVQWRTVANGGRATAWAADVGGGETTLTLTATANTTPPDDLVSYLVTAGVGETDLDWTAANDANQYAVEIRRATNTNYGTATLIATVTTPPGAVRDYTDTVAAGSYYYWLTPINGSGVEGTAEGPTLATVT